MHLCYEFQNSTWPSRFIVFTNSAIHAARLPGRVTQRRPFTTESVASQFKKLLCSISPQKQHSTDSYTVQTGE